MLRIILSVSVDYPVAPRVTKYGCDLDDANDWCDGAAASLNELDGATGSSYYYDSTAQKLYLKVVSNGYDREEL